MVVASKTRLRSTILSEIALRWSIKSSYRYWLEGIFHISPPRPYAFPVKMSKVIRALRLHMSISGGIWYWYASFSCQKRCHSRVRNIKGRQPIPKNTHPNKNILYKRFALNLFLLASACLKKKNKGGTVCTNCSEIICAKGVFLFGWVIFLGVGFPFMRNMDSFHFGGVFLVFSISCRSGKKRR